MNYTLKGKVDCLSILTTLLGFFSSKHGACFQRLKLNFLSNPTSFSVLSVMRSTSHSRSFIPLLILFIDTESLIGGRSGYHIQNAAPHQDTTYLATQSTTDPLPISFSSQSITAPTPISTAKPTTAEPTTTPSLEHD